MKALFAGVFIAIILGAFWIAYNAPENRARREAENYHAGYLASIERQRADLALEADRAAQPARLAMAPIGVVALGAMGLVAVGVLLGLSAAFGGAAVRRFREERRPDRMGRLPVPVSQLEHASVAALAAFHQAQIEAARKPAQITAVHAGVDAGGAALALTDQSAGGAAPAFSDLLDAGRLGPGNPMLLGFDADTGEPVEGSWLDLYSCGVAGLSGSGKSWTMAFLAAQACLFDSRIVLLDPHAAHPESLAARLAPLSSRFVCAPAESPAEMAAALHLVTDELARRRSGQRGSPLLFIVDEYASLMRGELAESLGSLVEALGQEGRKMQIYALAGSQIWSASRSGGTETRDSLASAYIHRCRPAQARMVSGLTAASLPADVISLEAGSAYLLTTGGELRKVIIPQMAPEDIARVASVASGGATSGKAPLGFRPGSREVTAEVVAEVAPEAATSSASGSGILTPEEARIIEGFLSGKSPGELAEEIAGSKGGRKYQDAAAKVAAALRRALATA